MPLCHSRRGSCTTRGPVYGLIPIENGISCRGLRGYSVTCPLYMAYTIDGWVLRMDKAVGIFEIYFLPYFLAKLNQLGCRVLLNPLKVLLRIDNSIIIAPIGDIKNEFP